MGDLVHIVPALLGSPENVGKRCGIYASMENVGNGFVWCDEATEIQNSIRSITDKLFDDMQTQTLQSALDKLQLEDIHTFKMDTEGYECAVLKGAPRLAQDYSISYAHVETTFPGTQQCVQEFGRQGDFRVSAIGDDTVLRREP